MAILIDPPLWPAHETRWSHLISDAHYEELHEFARRLGVPRRGFDLDHYDVPESLYSRAVILGAHPVGSREIVRRLHRSGLRVRVAERAALRPVRRRGYLAGQWAALGGRLSAGMEADGEWVSLGERLISRWNEPHRAYHDERHLEEVLLALDQLSTRGERVLPATLLAAWFHDAVYRGGATDEADSASLATAELGRFDLRPGLVEQVAELIAATDPARHVEDPSDPLAHLLDSDLWIFASRPERYEEYRAAVRREYAHVAAADFAAARAAILRRYLARPSVYFLPAARELWERRARENLANEVASLSTSQHGPDTVGGFVEERRHVQ